MLAQAPLVSQPNPASKKYDWCHVSSMLAYVLLHSWLCNLQDGGGEGSSAADRQWAASFGAEAASRSAVQLMRQQAELQASRVVTTSSGPCQVNNFEAHNAIWCGPFPPKCHTAKQ